MGRPSIGWQLRQRPGRPWSVRFTLRGRPVELGTGEFDRERAEARAAELYADAVKGTRPRRQPRRAHPQGQPLTEAASEWLTSVGAALDEQTVATYATYAKTHWAPVWSAIETITSATASEYARERLRNVQASTVRKELSALRGLLTWAVEQGRLEAAPLLPSIPKRTLGTRHKQARKGPAVELTPAEMRKLLAAIPVQHRGYPTRARFVVQYETGLRPSAVEQLSVPEHWRHGAKVLELPAHLDKARDGRPLPLSPRARQALASAAPARGMIFGPRDCRGLITAAAVRALGEERGTAFTAYYLRHNRITHWGEQSANLAGIMYLAGHKHASTTSRYLKPSMRAAREVLGTKVSRPRKTRRAS